MRRRCAAVSKRRFSSQISFRVAAEAWLAGIPRRVGFRGHLRSPLLTQIIDEPNKKKAARPRHQADRYWHIAKVCGAVEPPSKAGTSSPASIVLRHQTEWSPCFLRKCPLDFRRMLAVEPEESAYAIVALLDEVHRKVAMVG
ncbi:MAG TPA: hypothetical protein VIT00_09050 [Terrimicrobiaceae bacterium]